MFTKQLVARLSCIAQVCAVARFLPLPLLLLLPDKLTQSEEEKPAEEECMHADTSVNGKEGGASGAKDTPVAKGPET